VSKRIHIREGEGETIGVKAEHRRDEVVVLDRGKK
jgi:hypothetical protein